MPPKKSSGAPLTAGEEPLTAVLLADSFTQVAQNHQTRLFHLTDELLPIASNSTSLSHAWMPAAIQAHVPGEAQGPAAAGECADDQLHPGVAGLQQGGQGESSLRCCIHLNCIGILRAICEPGQGNACCSVANSLVVMRIGAVWTANEALYRWLVALVPGCRLHGDA